MRYLWIEDFNDGSITTNELEARLVSFFGLENDKRIIKNDLSSAISFLENRDNVHEIDAFLIDIRFPQGSADNIYECYFKDIVTRRFFEENIEDASGIMLYLLLVFRYHISQKKMAFISANVSSNNDKIKLIQEMAEIIIKSKYDELTEDDMICYLTDERKIGKEILHIPSSEKGWQTFIERRNNTNENRENENKINKNIDIDKLLEDIKALPYQYESEFGIAEEGIRKTGSGAQVKYNNLKNQFDKIGFAMPAAFEKPKIGEKADKGYSFFEWKHRIYAESYNVIRSSILEMCIILNRNLGKEQSIYGDFLNLLVCDNSEKVNYDAAFFTRYLNGIKGMFPIECDNDMPSQCERAIKEIAALWEASALPDCNCIRNAGLPHKRCGTLKILILKKNGKKIYKFEHVDSCYCACHAALKIVRNWIGHQGILDVNMKDVGFIFLICMRGLFDIDALPPDEKKFYIDCEKNILLLFPPEENVNENITGSLEYFCKLNNEVMGKEYPSRDIYNKISGLGNVGSKVRRQVSMDEIYMLFYHMAKKGNCYGEYADILKSIAARTWKDWEARYDSRFGQYCRAPYCP